MHARPLRTSTGLKNVTFSSIGPALTVKIVRVGVTWVASHVLALGPRSPSQWNTAPSTLMYPAQPRVCDRGRSGQREMRRQVTYVLVVPELRPCRHRGRPIVHIEPAVECRRPHREGNCGREEGLLLGTNQWGETAAPELEKGQ
jgi:hypothetical protein